ncbi:MAG: hypothetical protein ACKVKJ_01440 [Fidelibacterota bacterium]|tara:strand:+ start:3770 stop:6007 length:2238 start_codon:yes stop_codon:yes gene_type:complete
MKSFFFVISLGFLSAQARIGEINSITSSLIVKSAVSYDNNLFLATSGGLGKYNIASKKYYVFTKDEGLVETDIDVIHIGPNGLIWLGGKKSVQIWDSYQERIVDYFELDIEEVSGFTNYKNTVYGSVKNNEKWGIMEFIFLEDKIYYRDFYYREDIEHINNIVTFGEKILIHTNFGLIAGNPHKEHPLYWTNPYPLLGNELTAIDVKVDDLALVTSNAIYAIKLGREPFALLKQDKKISSINKVIVISEKEFVAISDSIAFKINNDSIKPIFLNDGFKLKSIVSNKSNLWLGTNLGFGMVDGNSFNHFADNEPIVSSPYLITYLNEKKWLMAGEEGISLNGWSNITRINIPNNLSSNLNIVKSTIDFGSQFSDLHSHNNKLYLSLTDSKSAGIISFDYSNGLIIEDLFYSIKDSTKQVYNVNIINFDKKNNLWSISNNSLNISISIFREDQVRHIFSNETGNLLSNKLQTMTVDNFNRIWFGSSSNLIMYKFSGEVLDPSSELWHKELIDSEFSSRKALNINVSPENKLWVLTNIGLIYKNLQADEKNPIKSTGPMINSTLRPYFPNVSFNFSSKIRFDPRGNIWVTSQTDGIHILKEDGNYWPDINGINTSNSNLLSNWVSDVTFNAEEGLAYIATNKGVSIIRIPFSEEKKSYNNVEIFPSPFRLPNDKPLTINGLMDNSEVKIMTLNGVVLRTISKEDIKGYQGFWDGRNKQGDYVGSGVYLLAFYNQEGASSIKKIAVIRK